MFSFSRGMNHDQLPHEWYLPSLSFNCLYSSLSARKTSESRVTVIAEEENGGCQQINELVRLFLGLYAVNIY